MTVYDRVSVIVGVILVGIVLLLVLEIPSRTFEFTPFGTPLTLFITGNWLVSALLLGLSCAGTEAVMRTHPQVRRKAVQWTFPYWILPGLATLALAQFLPQSPNLLYWMIGLVAGGAILAWLILAHYGALDSNDAPGAARPAQWVRGGLEIAAYALALTFFTMIYRTKLRSLVTATQVGLVAGLLALSILRAEKRAVRQVGLYAVLIGLVLGETTWALNYWRANALTVGVLMLLLFYALVGIVQQHMRETLNRRVVLEFLGVIILGIGIVVALGPQN
ncbi:MAG: hypothetical protein JW934_10335 [Anaerolineae bacterium]|nr:hypothetical protein [Anaerolineae bacterium]